MVYGGKDGLMNIDMIVKHLFPNARRDIDYLIEDSGGLGSHIKVWNLPQPKPTGAQLQAAESAALESEVDREVNDAIEGDKIKKLLFKINLDQENRLRVLEGKQEITKAQYKTALRKLYKTL